MIPLTLGPADQDKSIIAPIASTAAKATPSSPGAGATGGDIPIDDSSAEAVVQTYIALWNAKQMQLIPEIMLPQQAETDRPVMEALALQSQAADEFLQTVQMAFPDNVAQLSEQSSPIAGFKKLFSPIRLNDPGVTFQDNANAVATVELVSVSQSVPEQFNIRLIDGRWRIEFPQMTVPDPAQIQQQVSASQSMAQVFRDLTSRIQNNEFTSMEMVEQELRQKMQAAIGAGAGVPRQPSPGGGDAVGPAAATPPPAQPAQPPPPAPTRQREDVDNTFSGPGMLRAR